MAQTIRFLTPRTLLLVGVGSSCAVAAFYLRAPTASSALFSMTADDDSESGADSRSDASPSSGVIAAKNETHSASARTPQTPQNSQSKDVASTRPDTRRAAANVASDDDSHDDGSEPAEEAATAQNAESSQTSANSEGSLWSRVKRSIFGGPSNGVSGAGLGASAGGASATASAKAAAAPSPNGKTAEVPWNPAATNNNNGQPTGKNGLAASGAGALESPCDKCRETNCRHYLDTDLVEACFEQINPEHGADVSDRLFLRSCQDIMACAHTTGCAYGPFGPAPCYCGSADVTQCTNEGPAPDAPCRSRWQAAARTDDHALILNRMSDCAFPAGWAYNLLECEREYCREACSPH